MEHHLVTHFSELEPPWYPSPVARGLVVERKVGTTQYQTHCEGQARRRSFYLHVEAIMRVLLTRSDYWLTFDSCLLPLEYHNIVKNINFPILTSVSLLSTSRANIPDMPVFLTAPLHKLGPSSESISLFNSNFHSDCSRIEESVLAQLPASG